MAKEQLSVEALKRYVPIFQDAESAQEVLDSGEILTDDERVRLISIANLKQSTIDEIARLADPLIRRELAKLFKTSHLSAEKDDLFGIVYYAGLGGMEKGLRKFEVEKIDKSATNYLFQWIVTYAKKELLVQEAPLGIAPSRFQRHKKIAAVRKKLSEELNRDATNEEILEFFHSGRAELKRMDGPKDKKEGVSNANASITMELIEEQQEIEKNLQFAQFFTDDEEFRLGGLLAADTKAGFNESLFGTFAFGKNFTPTSIAVLKSELQYTLDDEEEILIEELPKAKYKEYFNTWKSYLTTPRGDFQQFISNPENLDFSEADLSSVAGLFDMSSEVKPRRTTLLFNKEKK